MNEHPGYIRTYSLHLSRTLDEIGLNRRTVKGRRDSFLYRENVATTIERIFGFDYSSYHFGSQTEGSTTLGMNSDVDTLTSYNDHNVIQDWANWERDKKNLLMLQEDTAPGYCRLQLLRSDIPTARQDVPSEDFTYDNNDRVIMKNTWPYNKQIPGMNLVRNGPARSECDRPGLDENDYVLAFRCCFWPEQARLFTRRQRRHEWPSQQLVQHAVEQGVFLVPVGYKFSPTEHMEWRISASLAERSFMFSLSTVHIKCYVVLKMLMKTFVEPHVGKCISSYHCKTAVLFCTENTERRFWRDDNLLQCVTQCLVKLLTWVVDGFCPQFFIPGENLFAGKVTPQNKVILQSVLKDLVKSSVRKLLNVQMDDFGVKLQRKLITSPSVIPVLDSLHTVRLLARLEFGEHFCEREWFRSSIQLFKHTTSPTVVRYVNQSIEILKTRVRQSNKHELRAVKIFNALLFHWLGSLLASISLSRNTRVTRYALQLLCFGGESDVAFMLKLASVLYCNNDARKAGSILYRLETFYDTNKIQPICRCYPHFKCMTLDFCLRLYALDGKKTRATRFAPCVIFSPQEINCAPPALQHELFRSTAEDMQHRNPLYGEWMDLAVVDCLPYLYFLQYMTYRQLGQCDLQTRALHNLCLCIREDEDYGHLETACNLLGQCLELDKQPEVAMLCYIASLEIRPRNNAANWHISTLCYRLIRDGFQ